MVDVGNMKNRRDDRLRSILGKSYASHAFINSSDKERSIHYW